MIHIQGCLNYGKGVKKSRRSRYMRGDNKMEKALVGTLH